MEFSFIIKIFFEIFKFLFYFLFSSTIYLGVVHSLSHGYGHFLMMGVAKNMDHQQHKVAAPVHNPNVRGETGAMRILLFL